MKKRSTKLKWMGLVVAGLSAVLSGAANAHTNMQVESQGGLKVFNPADNDYWFSLGGRLNLDEVIFSGSTADKGTNFASGGNIRRALLKFGGGLGDDLCYNLMLNFDGTNVRFNDLWLGTSAEFGGLVDKAWVRLGQFTPPTSIDDASNYGTLNNNVFMESALATSAFSTPTQVLGVQASASFVDTTVLSAALYQPSKQDTTNFGNNQKSDRLGGSLRLSFVPVRMDDTVLHVGAVGRYQSVNKNGNTNARSTQDNLFWTAPEARARQLNNSVDNAGNLLVNTGSNTIRAKSYNVATLEGLGIWGPTSAQAEYYRTSVQRVPLSGASSSADLGTLKFEGWHMQGAYLLTGETREYDFATGTLRNPTPAQKCGAWEIAARYSFVNLNDRNIVGGSEHNTTLGLNWFATENVYAAANYIRANIRPNAAAFARNTAAKRQLNIFGLRVGVSF